MNGQEFAHIMVVACAGTAIFSLALLLAIGIVSLIEHCTEDKKEE